MSEHQGYYGGGGYGQPPQNPYGQGNPYQQPVPQQPGPYQQNPYQQPDPYQQNPYAQPVPPQPVPPQPVPPQPVPPQPGSPQPGSPQYAPPPQAPLQPAPARPAPTPSAPGGFPGPEPRRSRIAVLLQFTLQWIYAPLWIAALAALIALLLWAGGGGPSGPDSDAWLKVNRSFIPPRRLKAELTGRPEDWERYVAPILERRIRTAEAEYAAGGGDVAADLSRAVQVRLALRLYRGLGAAGVVRLAERHGWHGVVDSGDHDHVRLGRRFPAPAQVHAPGPQDPPAAPGTPWGPRPTRSALLLPFILVLQVVYVPVYCLLTFWAGRAEPDYWDRWGARWAVGPRAFWAELTGGAAAWDRHIRRILARDIRQDAARDKGPNRHAVAADGTFVRRIRINLATYRGAGAQQVLRIAAEHGWQLDPAYTPQPEVCVRLCRPDRATTPTATATA
ncbi:hypothetical protein ACFVVX_21450 [Kitasatospora sp. NPDC058170]|uniref:hypothetical protein n=1 Tax=Kitasatospora sp. NPDC058170 TaxID=3346364 RepID=UPI0036DA0DA0